ncbi:pyridoxal-phosphate dependent enzyme [Sphingomonas daechungensis]|uniref:Pyridoxal-phosphate dependent enzyme n=1 Tax=Sphingomonas daechungensis TaxID=1176646 RepID=A0ABX6T0K4_9SPHN|nr:pyridoxal-phosphate dependent enzyme [Sphingomonas daechungensis]QNP43255.1 pyridoxal-phosphate dependent enzyme [Sphingomonas daechungensis]
MIEPVRPITIEDIEAARERIAGTVLRTPLVRLELGREVPEIWLMLENLQPTNAYKIRGAANAVARLSDAERARGVWTISAGNAGQGVAYAARTFGIPASVVAIETAPQTKLERMRALGATIVPVSYDEAWKAAESHSYPGLDGTFIHPSTITISSPVMARWVWRLSRTVRTSARSSARSGRRADQRGRQRDQGAASGRDCAGGRAGDCGALCLVAAGRGATEIRGLGGIFRRRCGREERHRADVGSHGSGDGRIDRRHARPDREGDAPDRGENANDCGGAGGLALAAALTGQAGDGPIVCVVSGGNIDLDKFAEIISD